MLSDLIKSQLSRINSPTMLSGMAVTGVVMTAYLSGRASFKAARVIDAEEGNAQVQLSPKEKVKLVWPDFIAPVSIGATTITCIIMANHTAAKKVAAFAATAGISERALQEYKAKVVEKLGENKAQQIKDEIAQDRVLATAVNKEVIIAGSGDVMCYDEQSGRYLVSSMEKLRQAENATNFEIINHEYASLSFFYDEIGLPPTKFSDSVGWNQGNRLELQFSSVLTADNRPCLAFDFGVPPFVDYARLW